MGGAVGEGLTSVGDTEGLVVGSKLPSTVGLPDGLDMGVELGKELSVGETDGFEDG